MNERRHTLAQWRQFSSAGRWCRVGGTTGTTTAAMIHFYSLKKSRCMSVGLSASVCCFCCRWPFWSPNVLHFNGLNGEEVIFCRRGRRRATARAQKLIIQLHNWQSVSMLFFHYLRLLGQQQQQHHQFSQAMSSLLCQFVKEHLPLAVKLLLFGRLQIAIVQGRVSVLGWLCISAQTPLTTLANSFRTFSQFYLGQLFEHCNTSLNACKKRAAKWGFFWSFRDCVRDRSHWLATGKTIFPSFSLAALLLAATEALPFDRLNKSPIMFSFIWIVKNIK